MRPNKDRRTEIILYGLLLIPLLFTAAALAQATEQAQGLAEITAVLSEILHTPSMLRWCASTPKFLLAVLVLYPLAAYCYMLDQADRHPGAEHGTAKWGSTHTLNLKYRNTKQPAENYILTENVRFSTDSHAHKHNLNIIVIGGSGSGKTRFYVKPNALQLIGSYLFLDPKGELTRTLGRIMEMKGISVTVLDLVHFQGHYNPMAYLEADEDAIKLAFAIVNNTKPKDAPSGGDKFWDDSSVLLISALILYLMYEAPASEQNFSTLMYTTKVTDRKIKRLYLVAATVVAAAFVMAMPAFADDPLTTINNLSDFVFSAIKAIGAILLGFGIVQIGLALKGHDASQRAQGFMTFFGGVVIYFAKDILDMIL